MLANCRLAAGHRGELRMVFTQGRDPGQHGVRGQAGLEHPFGYFLAISQQPFVANAQASSSASVDADLAAHGLGHFSHYRLAAQGRLKLAGPASGCWEICAWEASVRPAGCHWLALVSRLSGALSWSSALPRPLALRVMESCAFKG